MRVKLCGNEGSPKEGRIEVCLHLRVQHALAQVLSGSGWDSLSVDGPVLNETEARLGSALTWGQC